MGLMLYWGLDFGLFYGTFTTLLRQAFGRQLCFAEAPEVKGTKRLDELGSNQFSGACPRFAANLDLAVAFV